MYRATFNPGAQIFREGEVGSAAFVIERGRVEITSLRRGRQLPLATLEQGDLFGEMALVDDEVRMATATAVEETEVVVLSRERVQEELGKAGPLVGLILRVVLERLRLTHGMMLRYRLNLQTGEIKVPGLTDSGHLFAEAADALENTRQKAMDEIHVEEELRAAIDHSQFELFYQPIAELDEGTVVGFEALIRWRHPDRGLMLPGQFIGMAESTGLIVPIGLWALEEGCRALCRLQRENPERELAMNINVSPRQLSEAGLLERLPEVIREHGILPGRLRLEVTESLLVEDPEVAAVVLQRARDAGVGLVLDDFGTGYSSLGYLHRFPIETIKIDRSFVSTLEETKVSRDIVKAVVGLADALELGVVAEGIEDGTQWDLVRQTGCRLGQGYLFSRPVPLDTALALL